MKKINEKTILTPNDSRNLRVVVAEDCDTKNLLFGLQEPGYKIDDEFSDYIGKHDRIIRNAPLPRWCREELDLGKWVMINKIEFDPETRWVKVIGKSDWPEESEIETDPKWSIRSEGSNFYKTAILTKRIDRTTKIFGQEIEDYRFKDVEKIKCPYDTSSGYCDNPAYKKESIGWTIGEPEIDDKGTVVWLFRDHMLLHEINVKFTTIWKIKETRVSSCKFDETTKTWGEPEFEDNVVEKEITTTVYGDGKKVCSCGISEDSAPAKEINARAEELKSKALYLMEKATEWKEELLSEWEECTGKEESEDQRRMCDTYSTYRKYKVEAKSEHLNFNGMVTI
jgi:hypothetical protein